MATIKILDQSDAGGDARYFTICVSFPNHEFVQLLISAQTGAELDAQLQAYADDYEAAWLALPPAEPLNELESPA